MKKNKKNEWNKYENKFISISFAFFKKEKNKSLNISPPINLTRILVNKINKLFKKINVSELQLKRELNVINFEKYLKIEYKKGLDYYYILDAPLYCKNCNLNNKLIEKLNEKFYGYFINNTFYLLGLI